VTGGLVASSDCQMSAPVSGMSVNISTGEVTIPGNEGANQGAYIGRGTSTTNVSIAAANPSNPRIDLVCATVSDSGYTEPAGGSGNQWAFQVVTGTPTSGANLTNLNGVGALPGSSLLLGYVLVPALATNIIAADISNVSALFTSQVPPFAYINASGSTTAVNGQWLVAAAGVTVTLPATPTKNSIVAVTAAAGVSGSSQVTVAAGASGAINGVGLSSAANFKLGTPGAAVILEADGSNWWITSGSQDTGWVAISLNTNWTVASVAPAVRVIGNMAFLKGSTGNNTGSSNSAPGTIPAGMRPPANVYPYGTGQQDGPNALIITSAGVITTHSAITNLGFLALDGGSYTLV
jgi:hypothetical protein